MGFVWRRGLFGADGFFLIDMSFMMDGNDGKSQSVRWNDGIDGLDLI